VQVGGGVDNETGEHSIKNHLGQTVALPAGEVSDLIAVEKERNRRYYVRAAPIPSAPIAPALAWATRPESAPAEQCLEANGLASGLIALCDNRVLVPPFADGRAVQRVLQHVPPQVDPFRPPGAEWIDPQPRL
jgi:hypothetical protein